MERIAKIILVLLSLSIPVFANTTPATQQAPVSQIVTLPQCIKTFNVGYDKLFLLTETAINASNFKIDEIQSQGGYIVFSAAQYKFLATVFNFGSNKAILKITPCNNNYMFPPMIIRNIFRYIEVNQYRQF